MDNKTLIIIGLVIVIVIIVLLFVLSENARTTQDELLTLKSINTVIAQPLIMEPPTEPSIFGPESEVEFGKTVELKVPPRMSRRQRTYNLKPSKNVWTPGIYKKDELLYGVKVTPAQVLQESFDDNSRVETLALALQAQWGEERLVYAVENDQGNLSWEFFFYGLNNAYGDGKNLDAPQPTSTLFKSNNTDMALPAYLQYHKQLLPKDKRYINTANPNNVEDLAHLSAYSYKVSQAGLVEGVTDQFNLHFVVGEEIASPCETVHKKITSDGALVETGSSIIFCPSCMHDFTDQALRVGLSPLDIGTLDSFVIKNPDYDSVKFVRVSNNQHEMSVHLIGVPGSTFYKFLQEYDYPDFLTSYVQANTLDLDNFKHEIAFDFLKGGKLPVRTRFYGIF